MEHTGQVEQHTHQHTHEYTHSHEHSHAHPHEHDHQHTHDHAQQHEAGGSTPREQTQALLRYMLEHNVHHAAELEELAREVGGQAGEKLLQAVETFRLSNSQLEQALDLLK